MSRTQKTMERHGLLLSRRRDLFVKDKLLQLRIRDLAVTCTADVIDHQTYYAPDDSRYQSIGVKLCHHYEIDDHADRYTDLDERCLVWAVQFRMLCAKASSGSNAYDIVEKVCKEAYLSNKTYVILCQYQRQHAQDQY